MKPILIRPGGLTNRIWALRRYTQRGDLTISSLKDDVTVDAILSVAEHVKQCEIRTCVCKQLSLRPAPTPAVSEKNEPAG